MYFFNIILLSVGTIIMLFSLLRSYKLNKNFQILKDYDDHFFILISKFNLQILFLFAILYLILDIAIISKFQVFNSYIVSSILLFLSIFVFISTYIQFKMHSTVSKAHLETIKCLVNSVEARDLYTKGHSEHVANLVTIMYKHLPKTYKKGINLTTLKTAGLLHDIGKIGVPESILNKNGPLSDVEWKSIISHPSTGKKILDSSDHLTLVSDWIYNHHERIDGNGYYKIKNENIPLASKIIAIADTYSALVTIRPYRQAMSHEHAIEVLKSVAGSQLDAYLVGVFSYINKKELSKCNPELTYMENIV